MKRLTLSENCSDEAFDATKKLKRLTFHVLLHRCQHKSMQKSKQNKAKHTCKGKDHVVFRLCYGNYGNNEFFLEIANGINRFNAPMR